MSCPDHDAAPGKLSWDVRVGDELVSTGKVFTKSARCRVHARVICVYPPCTRNCWQVQWRDDRWGEWLDVRDDDVYFAFWTDSWDLMGLPGLQSASQSCRCNIRDLWTRGHDTSCPERKK